MFCSQTNIENTNKFAFENFKVVYGRTSRHNFIIIFYFIVGILGFFEIPFSFVSLRLKILCFIGRNIAGFKINF